MARATPACSEPLATELPRETLIPTGARARLLGGDLTLEGKPMQVAADARASGADRASFFFFVFVLTPRLGNNRCHRLRCQKMSSRPWISSWTSRSRRAPSRLPRRRPSRSSPKRSRSREAPAPGIAEARPRSREAVTSQTPASRRHAVAAAKLTLTRVDTLLGELYGVPDFAAFAKERAAAKRAKAQ